MRTQSRRQFAKTFGLGTAALAAAPFPHRGATPSSLNPFKEFDRTMHRFMEEREIPGGSLAVVKDGRLVYAKGYGWADTVLNAASGPEKLFRVASISKPITGTAILLLVQEGKLRLEDRVIDRLRIQGLKGETPVDSRWGQITLRHLLHHQGGWDRDASFDPMFRSRQIAEACGNPPPATPAMIIKYMASQRLDFDPGAKYAYSNFGYCLLGRIIEKITGESYETYVKRAVLAPYGVKRMVLGKTLLRDRLPMEARYVATGQAVSVFSKDGPKLEWPYGGFCLEAMDSHGGWLASAVDLARFAAGSNGHTSPTLKAETLRLLYERPESKEEKPPVTWYGCGWSVREVNQTGAHNYWHSGSLPGTATLLVIRHDGLAWAALFNKRSEKKDFPDSALDRQLHTAANAVRKWPKEDLFPTLGA